MAQNLYLLHYNNYFNRQLKRLETIEEYNRYLIAETIPNINFNPNDGVNTEQILNWDNENPDYIIVEDDKTGALSRWFVIDSQRLRNGQYKMSLKRDSVADHLDNVMTAPCLVEKGYLPENDSFIYNNEGQAYNQIKTSETLLKDKTGVPWIIGYIPSDAFETEQEIAIKYPSDDAPADITVNSLSDYEYWKYVSINPSYIGYSYKSSNADYIYYYNGVGNWMDRGYSGSIYRIAALSFSVNFPTTSSDSVKPVNINVNNSKKPTSVFLDEETATGSYMSANVSSSLLTLSTTRTVSGSAANVAFNLDIDPKYFIKNMSDVDKSNLLQIANSFTPSSELYLDYLLEEDGKIIKDLSTGETYKIKINNRIVDTYYNLSETSEGFKNNFINTWTPLLSKYGNFTGEINPADIVILLHNKEYYITLEEVVDYLYFKVPSRDERPSLSDAPYDMFCIPYSNGYVLESETTGSVRTGKNAGLYSALQISAKLGDGSIYDLQLLPYCPLQKFINFDSVRGTLNTSYTYNTNVYKAVLVENDDGTFRISPRGDILTKIMWCTESNFSVNLNFDDYKITVKNNKESSNLDMYRLCSPNFNGIFEFSAAKNGGVESYEVDCSYKPFAPYIHISPKFSKLYGSDFNDKRGLILGGDYSLPQLSNAWANYQLSNKNYQASFDREIQSLELKNKVAQAQDWVQAIGGSFTGSAAGMGAGAAAGPWGAAIGAAIGGTVSLATGITDAVVNQKLRKDELDKTRILFQYNLENIQALPSSLSKSSAFVINDRYFPFVEYYTCTNEERDAFRNKIKYQGMTIMRVGQLTEFLHPTDETFVKGRILRLEGVSDDFHIVNDISQEISQGLYIGGQ